MTDDSTPHRSARRARDADDDDPTRVLPAIGGHHTPRRSVTPDWHDDDDDDLDDQDEDESDGQTDGDRGEDRRDVPATPAAPPTAATPRWAAGATASGRASAPLPVSAVPSPPLPTTPSAPPSHDAFRPPADDADTVVIQRGDIAAALVTMGVPVTAVTPATPTWREVTAPKRPDEPAPAGGPDVRSDASDVGRAAEPEPSGATVMEPAEATEATDATPLTATERLTAMRGDGAASADPAPVAGRRPGWLWLAAAAVVLVLIIGGAVWWAGRGASRPVPSSLPPSASAASSASASELASTGLVGVADAALSVPVGWTIDATDSPVVDTLPAPLCIAAVPGSPAPVTSFQRRLSGTPAALLQRVEAYGSAADATAQFAVRATQLGRCSNVPVYLTSGATLTGLGDAAFAVTAVVQDPTPVHHTVVIVRTGSVIDTLDVWQPSTPIPVAGVMGTAAAVVGRQCATARGACVSAPTVKVGPPPAGDFPGWLTVADLPRVNPGIGRWTASDPTSTIRVISSQCENVTFATAPGPAQRKQRTFLLTEDAVPKGFGLDELLLDFDTPEAAAAFAKTISDNIEGCTGRVPTAKLGSGSTFTGQGAAGETINGYWRTVTQPTSASSAATCRISVSAVGKRVVYLLLTPSGTYDFGDEAWVAVSLRAAQRATQ